MSKINENMIKLNWKFTLKLKVKLKLTFKLKIE